MPTRTSYAPGTPCWVDVAVPDIAAGVAFYSSLLGWDAEDMGEASGHYHQFSKAGERVAGLGPIMQEGQPAAWLTYVAVTDLAATSAAVRDAGGQVLYEAMEIPDAGHMAVFADDEGTVFAGWQATGHPGCGLVNEPGALGWNEANRRDLDGAKAFYGAVFGWGAQEEEMPGGAEPYTSWTLDGEQVGGLFRLGDGMEDVPPHWIPYFVVEDCDAAVARVGELGGSTLEPPFDTPPGRIAVVADPADAGFCLIALNPEATGG